MKSTRILVVLLVLALLGIAAFLWLRPPQQEASPPPRSDRNAAKARRETAASASPAPEPVDLGSVLGLDSLSDCTRGPVLDSILEQMVRIDPETSESRRGGPIRVPGYDRPLVPTFERVREIEGNADIRAVTADLDLPGRWHGLKVAGLRRSFYEESDASAFEIRFSEAPDQVRGALIRNGFRLPPVGEFREVDDGPGMSLVIGVEPTARGAALVCATG